MSPTRIAAAGGALMALLALAACGKSDKESCPDGTTACSGECRDLRNDADNCGACGRFCGLGQCVERACVCTPPAIDCGGAVACVDTRVNPAHCGSCSTRCLEGETCNGRCECSEPKSLCPVGQPTVCTDLGSDLENCGACGNRCTTNHLCVASACICPEGLPDLCSDLCVDLRTSALHCGSCGTQCTGNRVCVAGACVCPAGRRECNGACVDTQTNALHCGGCANVCSGSTPCRAGVCCASGRPVCEGTCCTGGAACCTGGACPAAHANGLGASFFDCAPVGTPGSGSTYSVQLARSAANAWRASGTDTGAFPCGGGFCFARQAESQCAVWCYDGLLAGFVRANALSAVCICPTQADPTWR